MGVLQSAARSRGGTMVVSAGHMGRLAGLTGRTVLHPPYPWLREATVQLSTVVRRCLVPLVISQVAYGVGYGVFLFGGILDALGATERQGGGYFIAQIREISAWITMMVFAGVAGSAVTSDLGARKVREELDALDVLAINPIRLLVVPRIVAMTVAVPLLGLVSLLLTTSLLGVVAPAQLQYPSSVYLYSVEHAVLGVDVFAFTLKLALVGFFVGVVSCSKG